jgi:hypothetical protein
MDMPPVVLRRIASELREQSDGGDIVIGPTVQDVCNNRLAWGSGVIVGGKDNRDPHVNMVYLGKVALETEPYDPVVKDADNGLVLRPPDEITQAEAEQRKLALVRALGEVFERVAEMTTELKAARLALELWPDDGLRRLVADVEGAPAEH